MKNRILLILLIAVTFASNLRAQKMPTDYFDEGLEFVNAKKLDSALNRFQYIVDHYQKNSVYPMALFNTGLLNWDLKNTEIAKGIFLKILKSNFNEATDIGGNFMSSPYANFKYKSSLNLSKLFAQEKKYDSALVYLNLADTVYEYYGIDGNCIEDEAAARGMQLSKIYEELGQDDKSIDRLLKSSFYIAGSPVNCIKELKRILLKKITAEEIKQMVNESIYSIYKKNKKYYIAFWGNAVDVTDVVEILGGDPEYDLNIPEQKNKAIKSLKDSKFYRIMISGK